MNPALRVGALALALALGAATGAAQEAAPVADIAEVAGPDYAAWGDIALRVEALAEAGRGSAFALGRLRADLVGWRDAFRAEQAANAGRIATTEAQLAALGPAPAEGEPEEDARVAARRAGLADAMARLSAPGRLADEAYARADGLIGEIDALARSRQAAALLTRGAAPLDPRGWAGMAEAVGTRATGLAKEAAVSIRSKARRAAFARDWPAALVFLTLAMVTLTRGRAWLRALGEGVAARRGRHGAAALRFALSVGLAVLPVLGVALAAQAARTTGLFGARMTALIDAAPLAAACLVAPRWLGWHFAAPERRNPAPFDFSPAAKAAMARWLGHAGWALGGAVAARAFLAVGELDDATRAAMLLPFDLALAFVLFRFAAVLRSPWSEGAAADGLAGPAPGAEPDLVVLRRRLVTAAARAVAVVAALAPVLSLLGFHRAGAALLMPTVLTIGLGGLLVLLQWLVTDLYALLMRREDGLRDALSPVLAGFVLVIAALPALALIWGARSDDLREVWARLGEGFAVGETRLSPAVVVTFALVFAAGYGVTRLVQGTLRSTVLPRTRIDAGAQNAIVAGVGYLGLFLAAVVAVTTAGLDLSNLAIVAGALSVGIGFGLQNIVSNFVSGIILLIERPISEGDWIEVGGRMGYVRDISVRSTRIETFDRTDVIVPNSDLVAGQVVNWTRGNLVGRIILPVAVAQGSDPDEVTALLRGIVTAQPLVLLQPPPSVVLAGFGADTLNFEVRAIIRDVNYGVSVRSEMNHAIARAFASAGIRTAAAPAPVSPATPAKPAA